MKNIAVVLTCFNRKDKTVRCLDSLVNENLGILFDFFVVDDNSTDGTVESLKELFYNVTIIKGNGNLFWNGGMYKGVEYILANEKEYDYCLLVNDDVEFYSKSIEKLIENQENKGVIVGATCDKDNELTYGAIKLIRKNSIKYKTVHPDDDCLKCDTFNANCVLIPYNILKEVGNLDPYYTHSMGDFDYGFMIRNSGYNIFSSSEYVGICERNNMKNTWQDSSLTIYERIRKKESIKGLPFKQWFYYLNKNYGIVKACICSLTPYIKILIKR